MLRHFPELSPLVLSLKKPSKVNLSVLRHFPEPVVARPTGKCRRSRWRLSWKRCGHAPYDMVKPKKQRGQTGQGKAPLVLNVFPCFVLSCLVWSYPVFCCLVLNSLVLSYSVLSCLVWSGLVLSCLVLFSFGLFCSCLSLLCRCPMALSFNVLSCLVFSGLLFSSLLLSSLLFS